MAPRKRPFEEYFVVDGPHWFWLGVIDRDGYGTYNLYQDGKLRKIRAHRYSYEKYCRANTKRFTNITC